MKAHEYKKKGHMKIHANRRWLAMPKIIRRGRPYMEHLVLASHFIHHISTHMHFSIMVVWLVYSFGFNLWLCKIFEKSMPYFPPYHELHISLLEVGERKRTKALVRMQTLWAIQECHLRNIWAKEFISKKLNHQNSKYGWLRGSSYLYSSCSTFQPPKASIIATSNPIGMINVLE